MAAVVIILFSAIIVLSERKETQVPQTIVSNEGAKQDKVNLETVGNFENFYNIIKQKPINSNINRIKMCGVPQYRTPRTSLQPITARFCERRTLFCAAPSGRLFLP